MFSPDGLRSTRICFHKILETLPFNVAWGFSIWFCSTTIVISDTTSGLGSAATPQSGTQQKMVDTHNDLRITQSYANLAIGTPHKPQLRIVPCEVGQPTWTYNAQPVEVDSTKRFPSLSAVSETLRRHSAAGMKDGRSPELFLIQRLEGSRFGRPTLWVLNGGAAGAGWRAEESIARSRIIRPW